MPTVDLSMSLFEGIFSMGMDANDRRARKSEFLSNFTSNIFRDEFFVLYSLVKQFPKLDMLSDEFLTLYLNSHKGKFSRTKEIDIQRFSASEDGYADFSNSCIGIYNQCKDGGTISDAEFTLLIEQYILEYTNEQSIALLQDGATIITEGMSYGRKQLNGFEDMQSYLKRNLTVLENISHRTNHMGIFTYGEDEKEEQEELHTICPFGIEPLDRATGGVTEGDMISIMGVAKGGKSRFMTYLIHQALISGINVVVWSIENGVKGWEALIRARHFDYLYNSSVDNSKRSFISDNEIRKGTLEGNKKDREAASWLDLRTNKAYGKLTQIDMPFDINSYIETLDTAVTKGNAQIVAVDYLQLMGDSTGVLKERECIVEAYKRTLRYLKSKKIAGFFPAQIKQGAISSLTSLKGEELAQVETRDIASSSHEVIRTPDINLALVGSVTDIQNGHLVLVSCPSRNSAPFQPTNLMVDFGACNFLVARSSI